MTSAMVSRLSVAAGGPGVAPALNGEDAPRRQGARAPGTDGANGPNTAGPHGMPDLPGCTEARVLARTAARGHEPSPVRSGARFRTPTRAARPAAATSTTAMPIANAHAGRP